MTRREAQLFEVVKRLKVPTTLSKQPTDNKALKETVATLKNSTTQSGPTIHTAAHVGARAYISPTHTQQVMSLIDTAVGKNQSSGKNCGKPSDLFNNDIEPDPTENNQQPQKNPTYLSDINDSIHLFGNDIEPDPAEKNQPSKKINL
jgi:hypothetical protein